MVDHVQDRRHQAHWEEVQHNVVRYLRDTCQLAQRFSEEEINHVLGVLEVNAFEITLGDGQHRGRGLYPLTALMSHSCLSNTRYVCTYYGYHFFWFQFYCNKRDTLSHLS